MIKSLHTSMFQVRVVQQACPSNLTCSCAVIVQSGDDVIVLDRCNADKNGAVDVRLYLNDKISTGTRVVQYVDGGKYRVILPTSTYIDVYSVSAGSDFYLVGSVYSLAGDFEKTDGKILFLLITW